MVYLIARALGELSLYRPGSGSFATYAEEFLGPRVAFITGWSYWLIWILVGVLEVTGIGLLMKYWFPELAQWIPALVTTVVLMVINLFAVKTFGEVEFWLALIKVVTIVGLIAAGLAILLFGLETSSQPPFNHPPVAARRVFPEWLEWLLVRDTVGGVYLCRGRGDWLGRGGNGQPGAHIAASDQ